MLPRPTVIVGVCSSSMSVSVTPLAARRASCTRFCSASASAYEIGFWIEAILQVGISGIIAVMSRPSYRTSRNFIVSITGLVLRYAHRVTASFGRRRCQPTRSTVTLLGLRPARAAATAACHTFFGALHRWSPPCTISSQKSLGELGRFLPITQILGVSFAERRSDRVEVEARATHVLVDPRHRRRCAMVRLATGPVATLSKSAPAIPILHTTFGMFAWIVLLDPGELVGALSQIIRGPWRRADCPRLPPAAWPRSPDGAGDGSASACYLYPFREFLDLHPHGRCRHA